MLTSKANRIFSKGLSYLSQRHFIDDELALKLHYRALIGKKLDLEHPETFNEKLQWLKLYDRNPLYTVLVDKYEVKKWVAERIGEQYVVPTFAVWDSVEEIDLNVLPERFVLKTTHDSGGIAICADRSTFNFEKAKKELSRKLKKNGYWYAREWPYKDVPPRIIAEEYLEPSNGLTDLADYKFFCFSGEAKVMFVATNRFGEGETCFDFFDMEYRHLPFTNGHPNATEEPPKPAGFNEMRLLAETLSKGLPQVRVDFYDSSQGTFFGEMTFSHWAGLKPFDPPEWDYRFGDWIKLPNSSCTQM